LLIASPSGLGDHAEMSYNPLTIPAFLATTLKFRATELAFGEVRDGRLHWRTWSEIWQDVQALAGLLHTTGVQPGDRVAQVSENRYEWIVVDLALHQLGAVHVPIHVTLSGKQIAEQIANVGARVVFVSKAERLAKFSALLAHGETVLVHDEHDDSEPKPPLGASGSSQPPTTDPQPNDLATILFTSGTTGRPRGVMLSQRNLAWNAAATAETHGTANVETRINILPFSHIYARTCDLYTWLYRGSRLVLAESRETLARDCQLVQPTVLNGVPYVFERIADRVRAAGVPLAAVFGERMKQLTCGGAPIAPDIEAWYEELGMPLLPGYGLTEASPVISVSTASARKLGSVGRPLAGLDVRIADDGEVLVRGPNVMLGYWQDDEATAEVIRDGWLSTGDLGELDADGFLAICGRKKELIVLSTGKNVSPTRVESLLTASPLVEQVAVFGEGRRGLVALVVPTACSLAGNADETRARLASEINRRLATAAREEQLRDFVILDRPFSIERGELTPKLSLCREIIAQNFAAELRAAGLSAK
jgi:long-chain acyl-CoA synthetase